MNLCKFKASIHRVPRQPWLLRDPASREREREREKTKRGEGREERGEGRGEDYKSKNTRNSVLEMVMQTRLKQWQHQ